MEPGRVAALFVSAEPGGPMHTVASVEAVAGRGLQGDRYFGDYAYNQPGDITLFAREETSTRRTPPRTRRSTTPTCGAT